MTSAQPEKPATHRLLALDVLRGIAILGTLASNIWIFTGVIGQARGDEGSSLAAVSAWLPNGKFLGLLTIMFGIGLEIPAASWECRDDCCPTSAAWL